MATTVMRRLVITAIDSAVAVGIVASSNVPPQFAVEGPISPSPSLTSEPDPEESPEPQPIVIPGCEDLVSLDSVQSLTDPRFQAITGPGFPQAAPFPGEAASEAFKDALQSQVCVWGIPHTDAGVQVIVAELSAEARASLIKALDDSVFARTETADVTSYTLEGDGGVAPVNATYIFEGNVWVSDFSLLADAPLGMQALRSMETANPST